MSAFALISELPLTSEAAAAAQTQPWASLKKKPPPSTGKCYGLTAT